MLFFYVGVGLCYFFVGVGLCYFKLSCYGAGLLYHVVLVVNLLWLGC